MIMLIDFLSLVPLFLIGSICAYTDFRHGKIKNQWIGIGLAWGSLLYICLGFYTIFYLHQWKNIYYLIEVVLNALIALGTGYFFWHFNLWAAGDAKLFTLYAFLIPLKFYSKAYFPYFPSLGLLINLFIPLFLFLIIKALISGLKESYEVIKSFRNQKSFWIEKLKKDLQPRKLGPKIWRTTRLFLGYISLFVILQTIIGKTIQFLDKFVFPQALIYLVFFLVFLYFFKFITKNKLIVFINSLIGLIIITYLLINNQTSLLLNILKTAFIFMVVIGFLGKLLNFYVENKEIKKIKIKNLKQGMILSQEVLNKIKRKYSNKDNSVFSGVLREEQIISIKKLLKKDLEEEIKIYKTFPFSPLLFLVALATVFTKNSLSALILKVLSDIFTIGSNLW